MKNNFERVYFKGADDLQLQLYPKLSFAVSKGFFYILRIQYFKTVPENYLITLPSFHFSFNIYQKSITHEYCDHICGALRDLVPFVQF